jgi:hypothetical protein
VIVFDNDKYRQGSPAWWELHRSIPTAGSFDRIIGPQYWCAEWEGKVCGHRHDREDTAEACAVKWRKKLGLPIGIGSIPMPVPSIVQRTALSGSAHDLICELIGQIATPGSIMPQGYVSPAMQNGIQMEGEARKFLEMELGADISEVGFILDDSRRWGSSPDGILNGNEGVELKVPLAKTHVKYLLGEKKVPDEYMAQVHGGLIVTGFNAWTFLSYCPNLPPFMVSVQPDEYTERLRACLEIFDGMYNDALKKLGIERPKIVE